jgi:tripartite-type tricarboxylate transporter receptor subunit TctC
MLRAVVLSASLLLGVGSALAQGWPDRPVRLIVPYPAGGGTDIVARVLARQLSIKFNGQFIVDNRPGATGMIGGQIVARSNPDGYTLLVGSFAEIALNQNLFKRMTYDPVVDLTPISLLAWTPLVFAAHPSFKASNLAEFIELAGRSRVDFASPGAGSAMHLAGEYFARKASVQLAQVPYRGAAPAVADTVAGHVKVVIMGLPPLAPFLQSGALKAIAVASKQRSKLFPLVPAVAEMKGFEDFDFTVWFGLMARAGTPVDVLDRLQKAVAKALEDPQVRQVLTNQAAEPVGNSAAEFADFIRAESTKYRKIIELAGVELR